MKTCTRCDKAKPLVDFARDAMGAQGCKAACKVCIAEYDRERRDPIIAARAAERNARVAAEFRDWLWRQKDGPCTDCGQKFHPVAMDFDHLPGFQKLFEVSSANAGRSRASMLAELAKCELVCANCHRIRTYQRHQA